MGSPHLSSDVVLRLAHLARLAVPEAELPRLTEDLSKILGYVASLSAVDTTGIEPTAHVIARLPLRDDVPREGLTAEQALAQAPETSDGGFVVPAFVTE